MSRFLEILEEYFGKNASLILLDLMRDNNIRAISELDDTEKASLIEKIKERFLMESFSERHCNMIQKQLMEALKIAK